MKSVLLVKYGEIALRGNNRHFFEQRLIDSISKTLASPHDYLKVREQGRILIEKIVGDIDYDEVVPPILNILGIYGLCLGVSSEDQSIENIRQVALAFMKKNHGDKPISFKVETKRANKHYPMDSQAISADVGGYILHNMDNVRVDVKNPDVLLNIELRNNVYFFSNVIKALGGLPVGSSGKGMLLLSGGIDSPVAGFLAAKRGVDLTAVYFHSPPYTSERAKLKVCDLAQQLSTYAGNIKLYVVPFTDIQLYLNEKTPPEKLTIFLKRAMFKVSDILAERENCVCLINGDSIGQVASQTLLAIQAINSATNLPVIRPLAGFDKQEIVNIAKRIGTFEISIRPYEDCCTLFVAKHPDTRPKQNIIESMEKKLDNLSSLIDEAINKVEVIEFQDVNIHNADRAE